nr:hypothetical protein [Tanacetum cinerariifolium]
MNQNLYNSPGLDQPPQYLVVLQPPQETSAEMLQARENLMEAIQVFLKKYDQIPYEEKCIALLRAEEEFLKVKQALEEEKNQSKIIQELLLQLIHDLQLLNEIQPKQAEEKGINKQIEKPKDSLIIEDEDINTIPENELDEENESSFENLFHIPNNYVIFSGPLFDSYGDTTSSEYSSDNESFLDEDDTEKKISDLPFEFHEKSISSDENPVYDEVLEDSDGTNYLIDSIIDSSKIDPLLEEFASELALINPIPSGINEVNFDHEEDIRLIKKLFYDNSSPCPLKKLNSENSIESFSPYLIPIKDSDSFMEEIDTFLAFDDSIPPGIDCDSYDSKEDNFFLEYEPDPDELTRVVVEDIFGKPRVHMPNVLPTHPTICQDLDLTVSTNFSGSDLVVSFPSRNRNKNFDPGISIEVQSKRFLLLNKFSISFISDPPSSVLETLLPF